MPYVKPVRAFVGARFWLIGVVFTILLIVVNIIAVLVLLNLPGRFHFWKSDEGLAVGVVIVTILAILIFLPVLFRVFPSGKIVIDSSGIRWRMKNDAGEIRWDEPFTIRRWQSTANTVVMGESGQPGYVGIPVMVYEVSQGNKRITLYRGASTKEMDGWDCGECYGIMLFHRAKKITETLEHIRQIYC